MLNIDYFVPNRTSKFHVFLFCDYLLIEISSNKFSFHKCETLANICEHFGVHIPIDCNYLFCRIGSGEFTFRSCGSYQYIVYKPFN